MEEYYAFKYRELEKSHWWFLGRRDIIYRLIKDYPKNISILELGCSGGLLIEFLKKQGFNRLYGIDIDENAIKICKKRGIDNVIVADAGKINFKDQQFDIVIASDILEHLKNEDHTLLEWYRILKPGGKLIIFVPAFKFLWSSHDEINQHNKRYSKSEFIKILKNNGFKIEKVSYWNFILFLPICLFRVFYKLLFGLNMKLGDQLFKINTLLNKTLEYILKAENKLLSVGINYPLGISIFAIAGKNEKY